MAVAAGLALLAASSFAALRCGHIRPTSKRSDPGSLQSATTAPSYRGPATVWFVDDGERVAGNDGVSGLMTGKGNAVWAPGKPISLFGLPGETIAFQVVTSAGREPLSGVTVEVAPLQGPSGKSGSGRAQQALATIERFVSYDLPMKRRSGGKHAGESLGWEVGALPQGPSAGGVLPDPLIDIALAPSWADYPLTIAAAQQRVVWVDISLPAQGLSEGIYRSQVLVRSGAQTIAQTPLEIDVATPALPFRAVKTMVFSEPDMLVERIGSPDAVRQYQQLMHSHRLSTFYPIRSAEEVLAHRAALTGALFTKEHGYSGPGRGVSANLVVLGAYGTLREPSPQRLRQAQEILEALRGIGIEDEPGKTDIFLYTVDEDCSSPRSPAWRAALDKSDSPLLNSLRVGHTCSEEPKGQPVDLVMMLASHYRPELVGHARAKGKRVWIYNGVLPHTGTFLTDGWPISLRANAWLQSHYGIERWFFWESTFWHDTNRGGLGPYDPFAGAETFHNKDGDHCNGDGVLVYPGRQKQGWRSLDFSGVLPSIRLKQWRRGISDAGYLQLAREFDRDAANAVASSLLGAAFKGARSPSFPTTGKPYFEARRRLFEIIKRKKP